MDLHAVLDGNFFSADLKKQPSPKGPDTSVKIVSGSLPELGVVTWSPLEGKPVTGVRPGRPNTGH